MDGCAEHYRFATAIFLFTILLQSCNTIIDRVISEPGHGRYVLDGMNDTYKRFIFHLMATVQLPGSRYFDTQMAVQTTTQSTDLSLTQEFQKHCQTNHANKSL